MTPTVLTVALTLILAALAPLPAAAVEPSAVKQPSATNGPSAAAQNMVEKFGLREDARPVSEYAGWKPQKIVVAMPPRLSAMLPGFEQQLRDVAGSTELVFARSPSFSIADEMLAGADAMIGLCSVDSVENAGAELLWIHNNFVGMDRCAGLSEAAIEGRVFTNTKRLSGPGIAEHTIAMMTSLARRMPSFTLAQAENRWDGALAQSLSFGELEGKTLLVVGLGGIGSEIAWRAHGLGMRVIATRNSSREGPEYVDYVGLSDELLKLAAEADVIVNALPLTGKTTALFDKTFFSAAKSNSIFISVGRGKSTVTADLMSALESGKLFGAGLDVTDPEPLPDTSPLWQMDNVIITPHMSGMGMGSIKRLATIASENLRRYIAGEPLLNVVNMTAGY